VVKELAKLRFLHELLVVLLQNKVKILVPLLASKSQTSVTNLFCRASCCLAPVAAELVIVKVMLENSKNCCLELLEPSETVKAQRPAQTPLHALGSSYRSRLMI
jgi:hypothetical protein